MATHQTLSPKPADVFESSPDKVLHFLCWAVLSTSLYLAFRDVGRRYEILLLGLFGYSVILEVGQHWVPGRFFSIDDMFANGAGCLFIYIVIKVLEWRWPSIKPGNP